MTHEGQLNTVIHESIWISIGSMVMLLGGFLFWLIAGLLSNPTAIGYATTAFSIASLTSGLLNLGLGMAALRDVAAFGEEAYSALLAMALPLGAVAAILTFAFSTMYKAFTIYVFLAAIMAFVAPISLVSTNSLIALQRAKTFFFVSTSGLITKVLMAVILLLIGLSGLGITMAVTLSMLVIALGSTLLVINKLGVKRPSLEKIFFVLKLGLSNYPATLTTLFVSGGIVFLGILTRNPAQVGSFYIAVMASMAAGSFAYGITMATLPALTKNDSPHLKDEALRLALALTVPVALPLAAYPGQLLALLGSSYVQGAGPLFVLSWSTLPFATLLMAFARANSRRDLKKVAMASVTQLGSLILLMAVLIGIETVGAALAYLASTVIPLLVIAEAKEFMLMFKSMVILMIAYLASMPLTGIHWVLGLGVLEVFAVTLLLATKSLKIADFRLILSSIGR